METLTMTRCCACCGSPFTPRPQAPTQAFCSSPDCQRARKREWQRAKRQSDPHYQQDQLDAQRKWAKRNPDYWSNYRAARPEYAQRNREQQRLRDANGVDIDLAKMDMCNLPSGLYRITRHPTLPGETGDSWIVEITPVSLVCPRKMDVSREDFIDISSVCS